MTKSLCLMATLFAMNSSSIFNYKALIFLLKCEQIWLKLSLKLGKTELFFPFLCQQVPYLTLNKSYVVRACCTASQWPRYQHYFDTICGFKGVQRYEMSLCWLCSKVGLSFFQKKPLFEHSQCQLLSSAGVRLAAYPSPAPFLESQLTWTSLQIN